MDGALISCVVPAYNAERYLREALDSIVAQTYRPIEIIVVDDGSSDETKTIAEAYGDTVRYLSQVTAGPPATRNQGIRAARGEFVAFLDADDLWHEEKLTRQIAYLGEHPEAGGCVTHVQVFWEDDVQDEAERMQEHRRAQPIPGYATTTLLVRREVFAEVGPLDEWRWSTDAVEWFQRAETHGVRIDLMPDVLVYRRIHASNMTKRLAGEFRDEWLRHLKDVIDGKRGESAQPLT